MLKVGLTGNIGSGKTLVAGIFQKLGVPVFHADIEARKLFEDETTRHHIRTLFGTGVFSSSGEISRPALAEIVFKDPILLEKLNSIIHPAVRKAYEQWCLQETASIYTLYEAAILFESGHYKKMDKIICITAPEETRIRRVMGRDNLSRQEVQNRMVNQWREERKVELSDFVIRNDERTMVIRQVMEIHRQIIQNLKFKIQN